MHDLVIDNARIVDGTGAPSRRGSVAVSGGRIVDVGGAAGQAARERLDASGLALAPGFIDPHTHYDAQLAWWSPATAEWAWRPAVPTPARS
jgi:N-acyl-D-aspartate/D-glutamate deacylase